MTGVYSDGSQPVLTDGLETTSGDNRVVKVERDGSLHAIRAGAAVVTVSAGKVRTGLTITVSRR
ncbi:hypothetical protein [Actinoallomurus iriomotensis]|uniref:BIG2 domain-containing protein n=1 Tax=Actinoallomurus iriomotensis TaxID=478107 RepID=A0A9W6RH93_9ACTN|nr:hypothetical protein [Actinoallomurus iriomotensis]GLY75708.1 hypothetical protein Airi01_039750 [Actinoallomurus iriomotensis]